MAINIQTPATREDRLREFVEWCDAQIKGDEKGEAQLFVERLFIAFGQKGAKDVGGIFEERIRQLFDEGKKTSFADYVWKPVVLIEMKKRGSDLAKHRQQAFDYWTHIAPGRPKYVVLCNFDEFWIYDFNNQLYSPKDKVQLSKLPESWGSLAFLFPTNEAPTFGNDREKVTREAADRLANCFRKLIVRKVDRGLAQRFVLQSMIAMFAEDIELLPRYFFTNLVKECKQPQDSYDLLGGLFEAMNSKISPTGGRYKGVRYFNGGIFAQPARVELYEDELNQLRGNNGLLIGAAQGNWSEVEPEIFGAIFQESMDGKERHAFGAHFTSAEDIMKIVKPTISDPWGDAISTAKTAKKLGDLLERLSTLRVLDPACGSGNFLYLAYREMKRLETRIRERLTVEFPEFPPMLAHVNARQFFGIDINPFAVELAKVTLMIARKLAIDELHIVGENDLPLDNLDANFTIGDALMTTQQMMDKTVHLRTPWPKADVIIGNPPFLGAKRLKPERGADYVNALRKLYPEVPGMADYCVYWIRRAADHLPPCTPADPFAGRAGLVGTQNIRNNKSRVGGLDHVVATGTIIEAVDNQPWSGEANVHVSIANWIKTQEDSVVPKLKRIWSKVYTAGVAQKRKRGHRADKTYELAVCQVPHLNAALSNDATTSDAHALLENVREQKSFQGVVPGYEGFAIMEAEAEKLVEKDPNSKAVIKPWMIGRDLLTGDGHPTRLIVDFAARNMLCAEFSGAFQYLEANVLPPVIKSAADAKDNMKEAREEHLRRWWTFWNVRTDMRAAFSKIGRYIACSRVTKRPIFVFVSTAIVPDGALQVWSLEDDYSFGIVQSNAHWEWFFANCSKLKSDYRYTRRSVWDTFPWPQSPTATQIEAVAAAGRQVRLVREHALKFITGGLRAVYRNLKLPGKHPLKSAHDVLDSAVSDAYGFSSRKPMTRQLLELNATLTTLENSGIRITGPGLPKCQGQLAKLITDDCIMPRTMAFFT